MSRRIDEATIAALAEETDTDRSIVKYLYAEELAILESQASVKNFIGIIAARRWSPHRLWTSPVSSWLRRGHSMTWAAAAR